MDRLDAMAAFVLAVDQGSLSGAARKLGRSPAAVTRTVASLEERLGAQLLRRTTRSLKLTEAGERYLSVSRRVLAELAEAERSTRSALDAPQGLLTVTAPVMFGALHVRPVVDAFLAAHSEVRVRLLLLDRVVSVIDEGIDVALRIAHLPDSALVARKVGEVRRVVCASPEYLARHGRPSAPHELAAHRTISFSALTPSETWSFGSGPDGGRAKQVALRPVLSVNTAEAAIGSAIDGVGVTCAFSYQVAAAIRAGTLVPLLAPYAVEPLPVHLVHPAGATTAAKVRAFVELASNRIKAALDEARRAARPRVTSGLRKRATAHTSARSVPS
jgi:DNA-binding transcriptional LysR family regulator